MAAVWMLTWCLDVPEVGEYILLASAEKTEDGGREAVNFYLLIWAKVGS